LTERLVVRCCLCDPVKHRGHRKEHRLLVAPISERVCDALRSELRDVVKRAAHAQAAQEPQNQAVGMNQRQRMNDRVVLRPLPGFCERIQVGGNVAQGNDGALGGSRGA
jgi:hypothetical protein